MKHRVFSLLGIFLYMVGIARFSTIAATVYVSPLGSDTATGTNSDPFQSIQRAVNAAVAGDTVLVAEGTYNETVRSVSPGTDSHPIRIDGANRAKVMRFSISHPYIILQNFSVFGPNSAGFSAIELSRGSSHTILSNNVVDLGRKLGVHGLLMSTEFFDRPSDTNGPRHCLIISNYFGNTLGATAIQIGGRFNTVRMNTISNIYSSDFVRLFGHTNLIQHNRFLNNIYDPGTGNHADFIQTFGDNRQISLGHIIDGNVVSNIIGGQICQLTMVNSFYDNQHGGWTFKNNIFVDIELQASVGIPNVRWLHNAFIRCNVKGGHPIAMGYTEGRSNPQGAVILNNAFIDCGVPNSNIAGWYSVAVTNLVADYNYVGKNEFRPVRQEPIATAFRWFEPNGVNGGDPRIANLESLNLSLLPGSPLIDQGSSKAGVSTDFRGIPRGRGAPDIGPMEYSTADQNPIPNPPTNLRITPDP